MICSIIDVILYCLLIKYVSFSRFFTRMSCDIFLQTRVDMSMFVLEIDITSSRLLDLSSYFQVYVQDESYSSVT